MTAAALLLVLSLSAGCRLGARPFSPLPPMEPPPATVGEALRALEERSPSPGTFQAQGDLELSGEGIRGRQSFQGNLLYKSADRIRFRASRMPLGTIFEILQIGDSVVIQLNRERKIFLGSAHELATAPQLAGGVSPLELAHASLISESILDALARLPDGGSAIRAQRFSGALARIVLDGGAPTIGRFRLDEFTLRRADGLIQEMRFSAPAPNAPTRRVVVVECRGYALEDGRPYPRRLEFLSQNPATRLRVGIRKARFDPVLSDRVFVMDVEGMEAYPLAALLDAGP